MNNQNTFNNKDYNSKDGMLTSVWGPSLWHSLHAISFNYPTKLANAYLAGHYDHDGTQIYVNRGTGYWGPPLRIGIPAEISLIRLKKKVV